MATSAAGSIAYAASAVLELSGQEIALRFLAVLALIAINAFFVVAEFSMVSVRRSRISQLVEAGDTQAKTVQALQRRIDRLLSTTQLGITLSSLALGWIGEDTMAVLVAWFFSELPVEMPLADTVAHIISIAIAFILLAYLQIVLGELCPKSVALLYSERLSRLLGPPSLAIARLFQPFIWILNQSTRWLLQGFGVRYDGQGWYNRVTSEELQLIVSTERESTGLEAEERELLNNVFEFGEVSAEEVMVPRTQITSLERSAVFSTLLELVVTTGHSRFPVMRDSLDDIVGIIDFKELALPLSRNQLTDQTPIKPWIRPARFVPEFTPLSELLRLMQRSHLKMVMIVDEFGGTAGLVTLKDLVDEIIGDDSELENAEEVSLQMLDERTFLVQAQMDLEEVNELLDLELPVTDEYQTLGGFVLYQFQKIPAQGETLHYDDLDLTVVAAQGPRLHQIRIYRREVLPSEPPVAASETEDETQSDPGNENGEENP